MEIVTRLKTNLKYQEINQKKYIIRYFHLKPSNDAKKDIVNLPIEQKYNYPRGVTISLFDRMMIDNVSLEETDTLARF